MSAYLITRDGEELGSFELSQIQEGLQSGFFEEDDFGWRDGMDDWVPVTDLTGREGVPSPRAIQPPAISPPRPAPIAAPLPASPPAIIRAPAVTASPAIAAPRPAVTAPAVAAYNPYASPTAAGVMGGAVASSVVPSAIIFELLGTKPWVRFISVLMWIASLFVLVPMVATLFFGVVGASAQDSPGETGKVVGGLVFLMVPMGITALLVLYPTLKLTKYAGYISRLSDSQSFLDLAAALREQRRFWKFYGIMTLIYVIVMCIAILVMAGTVGFGFLDTMKSMQEEARKAQNRKVVRPQEDLN